MSDGDCLDDHDALGATRLVVIDRACHRFEADCVPAAGRPSRTAWPAPPGRTARPCSGSCWRSSSSTAPRSESDPTRRSIAPGSRATPGWSMPPWPGSRSCRSRPSSARRRPMPLPSAVRRRRPPLPRPAAPRPRRAGCRLCRPGSRAQPGSRPQADPRPPRRRPGQPPQVPRRGRDYRATRAPRHRARV